MRQPVKSSGFRVQFASKAALIRLAILSGILIILMVWLWLTSFWMPGQSYQASLPPLQPEEITLQNLLQQDIQKIAVEIGARNVSQYEQLNATKVFLETSLAQSGYQVNRQEYKIDNNTYYNLEVEKLGTEYPKEVVIIAAHYDSAFSSPGANDNGTGVAAVLELARIFANQSHKRTIRFVEFTNEEPPFFWTENMGSLVYAKQIDPQIKVVAMLSLETMGYFSDRVDSQKYPFPVNLFYPNQGNFIAFIGNLGSGDLVRRSITSFRRHVQFPSEGASLPSWIPGISWSDHWAFWQQGHQGIMITDTAPYRYSHYHTIDDTIDKINFDKLARVVSGLVKVITDLSDLAE
jgi:hypothetical protein